MGREASVPGNKIFVDLNDVIVHSHVPTDARVKVVDVASYGDVKVITDMAYRGNIIVMDMSRFVGGDAQRREVIRDLIKVAHDIDGAFMEVSERLMVITGNGMSIDKVRLMHKGGS